ncbi:MAG: hypothetical protein IKB20_05220 [Clostridia bacterium]|nr:hypothetical protein [Clostridia bacterium]
MWFFEWLYALYTTERTLLLLTLFSVAVLVLGWALGYLLDNAGCFAALATLLLGISLIAFAVLVKSSVARLVGGGALFVLSGAAYLLLSIALGIKNRIIERKKKRAQIKRRLQFTLPDRENAFVRARLNTVLKPEEDMGDEPPLKLSYASALLKKLKEMPLSPAERLQASEMENAFSLYVQKEGWTAGDLRAVNDLCSALIKLSAKYAV